MTVEDCRRFYAEGIRLAANVSSTALVEAYARVPREAFLGPGPWKVACLGPGLGVTGYCETLDADPRHVYHTLAVAIDSTRNLNNGEPVSLARWIDALGIEQGNRVYHLGCGVGYYTAIMAELVGPSGQVLASELDPDLAARAVLNLRAYAHVSVRQGDGVGIDPGPCDAIFINAGVTHPHSKWLDSLNEGGSLVLPLTVAGVLGVGLGVGPNISTGLMTKVKRKHGGFSARVVTPVAIYSCVGLRDPQTEQSLVNAMKSGKLLRMKSLRRDAHEPAENCLLHSDDMCFSSEETNVQSAL